MKLLEVSRRTGDGVVRLTGVIERTGGETVELFYEYPDQWADFVAEIADPFVAAMVLPAMWIPSWDPTIEILPSVSEQFLLGARTYIEAISLLRSDQMRQVELIAPNPVVRGGKPAANVGAFFSMGVDSLYTLLKHVNGLPSLTPRMTHLIHMKGVQEPLSRDEEESETSALISDIAAEVGLPVIYGRTNLRDVFDTWWGRYHGTGMASVGLSLSAGFETVLTPSAHTWAVQRTIGCHPMIHPWWSNELTRNLVDGSECSRCDKIVNLVGRDPLAQRYLRVCLKNRGASYNCGRCEKCIRTMVTLHLMGTLKDFKTFSDPFHPGLLRLLPIPEYSEFVHLGEVYEYAKQVGGERRIRRRLRRILRRYTLHEATEMMLDDTPFHGLLALHDRARQGWRRFRARIITPPHVRAARRKSAQNEAAQVVSTPAGTVKS